MRITRSTPAPGRPAATEASAPTLDALADRVRRLRPCHRDPERFHEEKDEIEREMRRLARQAR